MAFSESRPLEGRRPAWGGEGDTERENDFPSWVSQK